MLTFENKLNNYAKLIIQKGINVQEGQLLIISCSIENKDFALKLLSNAYEVGAKHVHINWQFDEATRLYYETCKDEYFDYYPEFMKAMYETSDMENAAYLSVKGVDPDLLKGIDSTKVARASKAAGLKLKNHHDHVSASKATWCVAQVPSLKWANKMFPTLDDSAALSSLYDLIFSATRTDLEDPVAAWNEHLNKLENRVKHLNSLDIKTLHYKSSTMDITLDLPEGALWQGGGENSQNGIYFVANMPTEEVFTMPKRNSVNGTLKSTMPLNYRGSLIEDFTLEFKDGKVVSYSAKTGEESLKGLLETDEGAAYLGEVALVPFSSPINQTGKIFYSTLFDENASCHFALGSCYTTNIVNGDNLSDDELLAKGGNVSITHVDFMVGSNDLNITATTKDNKNILIFENGEFTF
ncbi:MAG: aminopeptidase [Clostridium sp.]